MKTGCERRLDKSFRNAPVLALYPHSRIVLISDCQDRKSTRLNSSHDYR